VYDARTDVTSNLGLAVSEWCLQVSDPLALAIVWEAGQNATDLNGDGDFIDNVLFVVVGPLFADGFESGDTSIWSNTVP
jgi:hypothetical protein